MEGGVAPLLVIDAFFGAICGAAKGQSFFFLCRLRRRCFVHVEQGRCGVKVQGTG